MDLESKFNTLCKDLSKSSLRKLSFAMSLIGNPDIIILHNASRGTYRFFFIITIPNFQGFDKKSKDYFWEILESIKKAGKTVLLFENDLPEIHRKIDVIGILKQGIFTVTSHIY